MPVASHRPVTRGRGRWRRAFGAHLVCNGHHILLPLETDPAKQAAAKKTLTDIKAAVAAETAKAVDFCRKLSNFLIDLH